MKPVKRIPIKISMPKAGSPNEFDYYVGISKKVLQTKHVSHSCRQLQNFFKIEGTNSKRYYEVSVMASLKPRERRLH